MLLQKVLTPWLCWSRWNYNGQNTNSCCSFVYGNKTRNQYLTFDIELCSHYYLDCVCTMVKYKGVMLCNSICLLFSENPLRPKKNYAVSLATISQHLSCAHGERAVNVISEFWSKKKTTGCCWLCMVDCFWILFTFCIGTRESC